MDVMNSVTPKAAAKHDLLFNEPAPGHPDKEVNVRVFLLILGNFDVASLADSDRKLIPANRKWASFRRTAVANGLAALPAAKAIKIYTITI
jgi:hypothetical protein